MKNTNTNTNTNTNNIKMFIKIFIIFFMCVILIAICYNNDKPAIPDIHINTLKELFTTNPTNPANPSNPSNPINTINTTNNTSNNILNLLSNINLIDNVFTNISKNIIIDYLNKLTTYLNKYLVIDIPININNKGVICSQWGDYNNGLYNNNDNNCIILNNSNDNIRKCLNDNGVLSSCNNIYNSENNFIDKTSKIDISNLFNTTAQNIINSINNINNNLNNKKLEAETLITNIVNKSELEQQQLYFIKYNEYNINDKQHNINDINNKLEDTHTLVNIKQLNFKNFKDTENDTEKSISFYKKCIIGLTIILVIISIINFLCSNVL